MKILVTGGAGYLGSVLIPKLLARGHQLRIVDRGFFGRDHVKIFSKIDFIQEDLRKIETDKALLDRLLDGMDCVIHLAAISNDPSAELSSELTMQVNYLATCVLAEAAKKKGIRFVFSSSCSTYGFQEQDLKIDEDGLLHPLTTYAVSKVKSEEALLAMKTPSWNPVILRNGTLFGYSSRMRFDLVINIFSMCSTLYNEIKIFGKGNQWRPFLHVGDCARAFCFFAEKPELRHSVYNIAHENRQVIDLIDIFKDLNPRLKVTFVETAEPDNRDYKVSTKRMHEEGFETRVDISIGAEEIIEAIVSGAIENPESSHHNNVKWMKELLRNGLDVAHAAKI